MSALDHSTLLTKLIIASEAALQLRHGFDRASLLEMTAAIDAEHKKATDEARVIGDAVVMCAAAVVVADGLLRSYVREAATPFLQVVGVLLPQVRLSLGLAMEQRKRPTA